MKTRVSTGLLIATLLLFLVCAAIAQEPKPGYGKDHQQKPRLLLCQTNRRIEWPPPLTCRYNGEKLSRACKRILNKAARMLRDNPGTTVTVYGIDDSVCEYLSWSGVNVERILGKPFSGGVLVLVIHGQK